MNKFYVYKIGVFYCVKITKLKIGQVYTTKTATYWVSKKAARTWEKVIKAKYPNATLVECELKFVD